MLKISDISDVIVLAYFCGNVTSLPLEPCVRGFSLGLLTPRYFIMGTVIAAYSVINRSSILDHFVMFDVE